MFREDLYLNYGSNCYGARMLVRCPGARLFGTAILRGYRLIERLYADIEEAPGNAVCGVLWRIIDEDLDSLDRCEGVAKGIYTRNTFRVQCGQKFYRVFTYVMTPETRHQRDGMSYPEDYRRICSAGAAAELLDMMPETLARIDVLEGYPRLYMREQIAATIADGRVIQTLVYVMKHLTEGATIIPSGGWHRESGNTTRKTASYRKL